MHGTEISDMPTVQLQYFQKGKPVLGAHTQAPGLLPPLLCLNTHPNDDPI